MRCPGILLLPIAAAGCLETPTDPTGGQPDAGSPIDAKPGGGDAAGACAGLDLLIQGFEAGDPMSFDELWVPGDASYMVAQGELTLTAQEGTSSINSVDFYHPVGAIRFGPFLLDGGGNGIVNLYGNGTVARISIEDTALDLYSNAEHVEILRFPEHDFLSIAFEGGEAVFSGSEDGVEWAELRRLPNDAVDPMRIAISVRNLTGLSNFVIKGINTAETGNPCAPPD